jgi:hypothetical protein
MLERIAFAFALAGCAASPPGSAATAGTPRASGAVLIEGVKWRLYDGEQLPSAVGMIEGPGAGGTAAAFTRTKGDGTVSFDSREPANKATWVVAPAVEKLPSKGFTFVVRLKADDPSERALDLDFRIGGPRAKLVVSGDEIQIEKPAGQTASTRKHRLDASQFHTYQLAFTFAPQKIVTDVYVDGDDQAAITAAGILTGPENRFAFGDMGSNRCKSTIDWMAWTDGAALKPSALKGWLPTTLGDMSYY